MLLALGLMDPTVRGIFMLVAVVLFVIAAFVPFPKVQLVALGLAFFAFPFMWDAFAAS
jgi:hypothetical protein